MVNAGKEVLQAAISATVTDEAHQHFKAKPLLEGPILKDWATEWESEDQSLDKNFGSNKNRGISGINIGQAILVHFVKWVGFLRAVWA